MTLSGLPWFGGKSAGHGNNNGIGKWVASMLPQYSTLYVEPFAGMLGILLQRDVSKFEIVNDKSECVINWWRCVRDDGAELSRLIALTPNSRTEYEWALCAMYDSNETPIKRALAFTIVCRCSLAGRRGSWSLRKANGLVNWRGGLDDNILLLYDRIKNVQFENRNAIDILKGTIQHDDCVIYCDPPYKNIDTPYDHDVDYDDLSNVLLEQRGKVAVSGYSDDWDHLGWERHEYQTHSTNGARSGGKSSPRTEVLWTNYDVVELTEGGTLWMQG